MARFSLHAIGRDRPGIVAAVAGALAEIGANLGDSRMTILHGQFAIVLVLEAPGVEDGAVLEHALEPIAEELNLLVAVRPLPENVDAPEALATATVSVHGSDHPGIVARIAREIANSGGNVVDVETRVLEEPGGDAYVMLLTVRLAGGTSVEDLDKALAPAARELGVRCVVASGDADLL